MARSAGDRPRHRVITASSSRSRVHDAVPRGGSGRQADVQVVAVEVTPGTWGPVIGTGSREAAPAPDRGRVHVRVDPPRRLRAMVAAVTISAASLRTAAWESDVVDDVEEGVEESEQEVEDATDGENDNG